MDTPELYTQEGLFNDIEAKEGILKMWGKDFATLTVGHENGKYVNRIEVTTREDDIEALENLQETARQLSLDLEEVIVCKEYQAAPYPIGIDEEIDNDLSDFLFANYGRKTQDPYEVVARSNGIVVEHAFSFLEGLDEINDEARNSVEDFLEATYSERWVNGAPRRVNRALMEGIETYQSRLE